MSLSPALRPVALGLAVCLMAACGSLGPREEMSDGQRTYLTRCTSCHDAYEPHEYAPADWRKAVSEMESEHGVKLTAEEKALILGYVTGATTPPASMPVQLSAANSAAAPARL